MSEIKEELGKNGFFVKEQELESGLRIVTVGSEIAEQPPPTFQEDFGEFYREFESAFQSLDADAVEKYTKLYFSQQAEYLRGVCFSDNMSGVYSSVLYLKPLETYSDFQSFLSTIQNYLEQ